LSTRAHSGVRAGARRAEGAPGSDVVLLLDDGAASVVPAGGAGAVEHLHVAAVRARVRRREVADFVLGTPRGGARLGVSARGVGHDGQGWGSRGGTGSVTGFRSRRGGGGAPPSDRRSGGPRRRWGRRRRWGSRPPRPPARRGGAGGRGGACRGRP